MTLPWSGRTKEIGTVSVYYAAMQRFPLPISCVLLFLGMMALALPAQAQLMPTFPSDFAWNASDIIVATEGNKIDGILSVLETWKGVLRPGQQMSFPELAWFSHSQYRRISVWPQLSRNHAPHYITGRRLVLFLCRHRAKNGGNAWTSANGFGLEPGNFTTQVTDSAVWIEQQQVYRLGQDFNPGPTSMVAVNMTEAQLKEATFQVMAVKRAFYQTVTLPDRGRRAAALVPFTHFPIRTAQALAWQALGECGQAATPTLKALLHTAYFPPQYADIVAALARAEGTQAGPYLTHVIQEETTFWVRHTQELPKNWWMTDGWTGRWRGPSHDRALQHLLDHFDKASVALYALRSIHYAPCEPAVRAYREVWYAHPPHNDRTDLYEMRRACADILNAPLR